MAANYKEAAAELRAAREALEKQERTPASGAVPLAARARNTAEEGTMGFKTPRDFLNCVMKAYSGHGVDKRVSPLSVRNIQKAQAEAGIVTKAVGSDEQSGANDPFGGFLVPPSFSPEFMKVDPEVDPIAGRTKNVPMNSPIVKINARTDKNHTSSVSGGLTVTRRPETVAFESSRMQVEQITLSATTLAGLAYATEEILTDSPQSFAALIADGFAEQFAYHLVKERLNGTGVGEYLGVWRALDSSSLGPTISVAKETGQAAATIEYFNVLKMRSRCWGYGKAIWIANHDTIPQLMTLNQAVGTGGSVVWQPSAREDHPDMLLGRPIFFSEYAQTLGTQGDIGLYNWGEYLEGTYQPMMNDMSVHVRFVQHERAFKFWTRNAGAPWWRTALTPINSSSKLSPFVLLDTRS